MTEKKPPGPGGAGGSGSLAEQVSGQNQSPSLPEEAEQIIKRKLKETYQSRVDEPLPDRFAALLDRLAKS